MVEVLEWHPGLQRWSAIADYPTLEDAFKDVMNNTLFEVMDPHVYRFTHGDGGKDMALLTFVPNDVPHEGNHSGTVIFNQGGPVETFIVEFIIDDDGDYERTEWKPNAG